MIGCCGSSGVCELFDSASSEDLKDVNHLVRSVDVRWMFEALPSKVPRQGCRLLGCLGVLAPNDFYLFGPRKIHLGGHRCRTYTEVQEAVSQWLR